MPEPAMRSIFSFPSVYQGLSIIYVISIFGGTYMVFHYLHTENDHVPAYQDTISCNNLIKLSSFLGLFLDVCRAQIQ